MALPELKNINVDKVELEPCVQTPLKVLIHGPPASGKTSLARRLCRRYGAHYVNVKVVIDETMEDLYDNIQAGRVHLASIVDFSDTQEKEKQMKSWEEQIRDIDKFLSQESNPKLPDDYVVRLLKAYLVKPRIVSSGYVLDGYPKTLQQTKELFGQAAERPIYQAEATGGINIRDSVEHFFGTNTIGDTLGNASSVLLPKYVVSLLATDRFLCERVMKLPQKDIKGTRYDESEMVRRLVEFRANNKVENMLLRLFDEAGIHPILIDIMNGNQADMEDAYQYLCNIFGKPIKGLGMSEKDEALKRKRELLETKSKQDQDRIEREVIEKLATAEYEKKMENWTRTLEKLKIEEQKVVVAQSEPLRYYLMDHVFPVVTKGLIEVARLKPDDPIDFLAEFLIKENPEARMFDPSYTKEGDDLINDYQTNVEPTMNETMSPACK